MQLLMSRKSKRTCSIILSIIMVFGIVLGNTPIIVQKVMAEESGKIINYSFFKLGLPNTYKPGEFQETQEGWEIIDATCSYLAQPTFGITLQSSSLGHNIRLSFDIPSDGYYLVKFSGFQSRSGGVGAIIIDEKEIAQYNFSADSGAAGPLETLGTVNLTQGTHELKLNVKAKGSYGDKYYYLYPTQFELQQVAAPPTLETVSISSDKSELLAGQTAQLRVSGVMTSGDAADLSGENTSINYVSSNPEFATVNESGLVTTVAPGTTTITTVVTLNGVTKQAEIQISVSDKSLDSVSVTIEKTDLCAGETAQLTISALLTDSSPVDLNDAEVTYQSSDTNIISVSNNGLITGVSVGTADINVNVKLGNVVRKAVLKINVLAPTLSDLRIIVDKTELLQEETVQLKLSGILSDGTTVKLTEENAVFTFSSDKPEVASVNGTGIVTAIGVGTAKVSISAQYGEITKDTSIIITVSEQINEEEFIFDFHKLGLEIKYGNAPAGTFQEKQEGWDVLDASCGYVSQPFGIAVQSESLNNYLNLEFYVPQTSAYQVRFKGTQSRAGGVGSIIIDGQPVGTFNFSADALANDVTDDIGYIQLTQGTHILTLKSTQRGTLGSKWYYMYPTEFILAKVMQIPELSEVNLSADKTELIMGQTAKLKVDAIMNTGEPADLIGKNASIIYESDNQSVAAVSADGTVSPVSPGTVNITVMVTLDNVVKQDAIAITVLDESLAEVAVIAEKTEIPLESQIQLSVNGTSTGGKDIDLSEGQKVFTSSNSEIAVVDQNGLVTALSTGTVIIKVDVTLGNTTKSRELELIVTEPLISQITLNTDKAQIVIGRTAKVIVSAILSNGKPADLTKEGISISYQSENDGIATVDENGIVTAVKEGTVVIKAVVISGNINLEASVQINVINPASIVNTKTRSTYYTDEKVAAARENVQKYDWAKALKDAAVVEADQYLAINDEFIWNMVTPQSIPRTMFHIQRTKAGTLGCPVCGTEITKYGPYPWKIDPINDPWKLTCPNPNCNIKFPTNDFGAYYKSGLNEHGIFNSDLADKSLLKNTLYPEKGELWGVDDGYGWKDGNDVWTFIAYYNHWALWYQSGIIEKAVKAFRDAYIYTGDLKYAHAGIILLDRIADVYPDMDIAEYLWADGFDNGDPSWHTCQGKVLNDIWETFIVTDFASAYDAFFPALNDIDLANVVPFLSDKADQYGLGILKYSVNGIKKNIEDNILRQVLPAFKNSQIRGNQGMHQATLAMAAVVLDEEGTTQEMLDFNFKSGGLDTINGSEYPNGRKFILTGGNILSLLVNDVDRDGAGNEASPGYNSLWINQMMMVADVLDGYDRYPEADLYKNVKFRKMFQSHYPLIMIGNYIPSIGDSGGTGLPGISLSKDMFVKAYEKFEDPIYAQVAYMLNGNSTYGLHGNVFSANPESMAEEIKAIIETNGPLNLESTNMTGYGLAALRDGRDHTRKVGYNYDFMEMPIAETSGKEYKTVSFPALFYRSAGADDYITFKFTVSEADEYSIGVKTLNAALYGKYIVKLDGEQIGDEFDAYGTDTVESELMDLGKKNLTAGEHTIAFMCTGKNEASQNYVIGLRNLVLLNKDAEEAKKANDIYGNQQRDVWMYYGRNTGHGHKDTLNLGVHAYGLNLAPDLGYPEYTGADPKRLQWINNTISHNTVVVDKTKQGDSWVGMPRHFDESELVSLMDIEASDVYSQTEMYRRTTAMINVDDANSYVVDFFRIIGGEDHHFSFHSNEAIVTTEGLNLASQEKGTYAGPDIEFGKRPSNDSVDGTYYMGPGFHYLYNVEKEENPQSVFSIDWNQTKDPRVHLRLTMLGEVDDVAIADGEPPLNNTSNPRKLKYMIAHRTGENLDSTFASVIEPYKEERYIESISPVTLKVDGQLVEDNNAKAVKVVLKNGRSDYIIYSLNKDVVYTVDDKFEFNGFFGVYSEMEGKQIAGYVNDGSTIGEKIRDSKACLTGKVAGFTKDMSVNNEIIVQMDTDNFNNDELIGRHIYVENDGIRNAVYKIEGVKSRDSSHVVLDIGDATPIRSWVDAQDFSKGFIYDIAEESAFIIPLSNYKESLFEVGNVKFTDLEGNEIKSLVAGTDIRGGVEITNNTGRVMPAVIIVALFDKNNRVVNYSMTSQKIGTNTIILEAGFRLPDNIEGHKIKAFIWDSWEGMKPISNAVVFPQE